LQRFHQEARKIAKVEPDDAREVIHDFAGRQAGKPALAFN